MAYAKTTWADRQVQKPLTFTQTTNGDGTITLAPAEGTITQSGTPITALNLNNLETQYDAAVSYVTGRSSVLVNSVGGMNVQSGVVTKVTILTGVVEDIQTEWSNTAFTAKESGVYGVRSVLEWASTTIPSNSQVLYLYKNGTSYNTAMSIYQANVRYAFGDSYVRLAAGDKIEFYVMQDSSGTQKTLGAARFEVVRIS
jgi:hypothetical protein